METEELVIEELNQILKTELSGRGYVWDVAENAIRVVGETFNAAPLTQPDDFTFGILYLMQELAVVINPGKFDGTVVQMAMTIARMSSESRLQLKAFELLMALSKKIGIAGLPIKKVEEFLQNKNLGEERIERAEHLWEITIKRASEMDLYSWKIRRGYTNKFPRTILQASKVLFLCSTTDWRPYLAREEINPTQTSVDNILKLLTKLEKTLVCPIGTEDESSAPFSEFSCGHIMSLGAWKTWQEKNPGHPNRCPQCRAEVTQVGNPLPMGIVAEIIRDIKNESQVLRGLPRQNQDTPLGSAVWESSIAVALSESNPTKQQATPSRTTISSSVPTNETRLLSTSVTWDHSSRTSSEIPLLNPAENNFTSFENSSDDIDNGVKLPRESLESEDSETNRSPTDQLTSPLNKRMSLSSFSNNSTSNQRPFSTGR